MVLLQRLYRVCSERVGTCDLRAVHPFWNPRNHNHDITNEKKNTSIINFRESLVKLRYGNRHPLTWNQPIKETMGNLHPFNIRI